MVNNCLVCYDDKTLTLPCNCIFCEECIFDWIAEKNFTTLYTGMHFLTCPSHTCKKELSLDWLYKNLSNKYLRSLNEIFLRKHLNTDKDIQKCPSCNHPGFVDRKKSCSNYLSCEVCYEKWFDSTLSSIGFIFRFISYIRNIKENVLSDFSELNVLLTSKPCPNCKIKIHKTAGCDHMICSSCNTDFCYNCMGVHSRDKLTGIFCGNKYFILGLIFCLTLFGLIGKFVFTFYYVYMCLYWSILWSIIHAIFVAEIFSLVMLGYVLYRNTIEHKFRRNNHYYSQRNTSCDVYKVVGVTIAMLLMCLILYVHYYLYNSYEAVSYWTYVLFVEATCVISLGFVIMILCIIIRK
jgi:hypothetical protein